MKTLILDVQTPAESMADFARAWKAGKTQKSARIMSKPYSILREKMKPAARKKAAEKTKTLLNSMPLRELRHARNLSQEQLILYRWHV